MVRGADDAEALSPAAEAFRQQLKAQHHPEGPEFTAWRRTQGPRRAFAWTLGLALMCPGLLCLAFDAPLTVSIGLEVLGLVANWWLRRERRRHLLAIAHWDADPGEP